MLGPLSADSFTPEHALDLLGGTEAVPSEGQAAVLAQHVTPLWRRYVPLGSLVNLAEPVRGRRGVWALAYAAVSCPRDMQASFHVGSGNAYVLWVNGTKVNAAEAAADLAPERDLVRASLHAGINNCLMAVRHSLPVWGFLLRIDGETPTPPPPVVWDIVMDNAAFPRYPLVSPHWMYKTGDDPSWAGPELDDSDWPTVPQDGVPRAAFAEAREGSGREDAFVWFRLHGEIAPERVGDLRVFDLGGDRTCEIFVDGARVCAFGHWAPWFKDLFRRPELVSFEQTHTLIALRYRCSLPGNAASVMRPPVVLEDYGARMHQLVRQTSLHEQRIAILFVLSVFLVFLLARYLGYRKRMDSLLLAITVFVGILAVLTLHLSEECDPPHWHGLVYWVYLALAMAASLCGLLVLTVGWHGAESSRSVYLFGVLGVVAYALARHFDSKYIALSFTGLIAVEYVRVYVWRIQGKRRGAWIIGVAVLCYIAGLVVNTAPEGSRFIPRTEYNAYGGWYGFCGLMMLLSIYFALDFAHTAKNLDALRNSMQDAMEREQRRIGQDIHDGLIQHLSGLHFMAQVLGRRLKSKSVHEEAAQAEEIAGLISQAATQARGLSHGLCPVELETEGLPGGLHSLAAYVKQSSELACVLRCDPDPAPFQEIPLETAIHVYRIAQEAINNAIKHGSPGRIDMVLARDGSRNLMSVTDDGSGFDITPGVDSKVQKGLGIRSMRYRAEVIGGMLTVKRTSEGGTSLTCSWPNRRG